MKFKKGDAVFVKQYFLDVEGTRLFDFDAESALSSEQATIRDAIRDKIVGLIVSKKKNHTSNPKEQMYVVNLPKFNDPDIHIPCELYEAELESAVVTDWKSRLRSSP